MTAPYADWKAYGWCFYISIAHIKTTKYSLVFGGWVCTIAALLRRSTPAFPY
jgi:hypothetical protein